MVDVITERFYQVDACLKDAHQHLQAGLWPNEVMTLARWHVLKGGGNRAFYRWRIRDSRVLFPPARTHTAVSALQDPRVLEYTLMAKMTRLRVAAPDDIELLHPIREGRSAA